MRKTSIKIRTGAAAAHLVAALLYGFAAFDSYAKHGSKGIWFAVTSSLLNALAGFFYLSSVRALKELDAETE